MPLRSPTYLDLKTLLAHAQYAGVEVPVATEVVERAARKGSLSGSAGFGPLQGGAERGRETEVQRSYSLDPQTKAVVSRAIDELILAEHIISRPDPQRALSKGDAIELDGWSRMTPASMVGKMFHLCLRTIQTTDQDIRALDFAQIQPELMDEFKKIYAGNEVLPIPILLELTGTGLDIRTFVSLSANNFVDAAGVDRVEGDVTVLGTVSQIVDEGKGLNTERWLLDGYEWLLRRVLMTNIDDVIARATGAFDVKFDDSEVRHVIQGPAIVIDGVAVY